MGVPAARKHAREAPDYARGPANEVPVSPSVSQFSLKSARRLRWPIAALGMFTVLCGLFIAWGWHRQGTRVTGPLFLGSAGLDLVAMSESAGSPGRAILHVDWNHQCPLLLDTIAGHLTVTNDQTRSVIRKLDLSPSELSAGRVEVELDEQPLDVSLALSMSDSTRIVQEAKAATGAAAK
jgi:hypothetical protein